MQPQCHATPASPPLAPKKQQPPSMNHVLQLAALQKPINFSPGNISFGRSLSLNNFEGQVRLQRRLREMNP